jgi:hypothetical protein
MSAARNQTALEETPFHGNPFDPEEESVTRPEGFNVVRGFELPLVTRHSVYPFADLKVHDAIIFETPRELKNALQAARTFRKQQPKFKVSGRKVTRGKYEGKYAIIRMQ